MRSIAIHLFILSGLIFGAGSAEARGGCCSSHGGVQSSGCGCNDGTPLSAICAPYYSCIIAKFSQAISFGLAPTLVVGGTGAISATATSSLPVTFSSTTTNICIVSGSTVTGVAVGACTIAANQVGNASYNAATQVTQNIIVAASTTPVVSSTSIEFYNAGINHYFMTASPDEAVALDNKPDWGWARTGKTFDVWLTQASAPSGAAPVCRFFGVFANGTVGSHFYTVDTAECAYVKSRLDWGWGYENDAFYAVKPTGSSCQSGTSPVYRAFNNGMGGAPNHRYMASQTDLATMVSQGWSNEGIVMCSVSAASADYAKSAKLVGGAWTFTYTILSTFSDIYSFASVDSTPYPSGTYYANGTDAYGGYVAGGYAPSISKWSLYDSGTTIDQYYTFTFTDNNHVSGCYYLINPPGSTTLSKCYPMIGSRSPAQPLGKGFASSVASQPHKSDPEALMREVASDTTPGFIERGAAEAYLSLRKEIQ